MRKTFLLFSLLLFSFGAAFGQDDFSSSRLSNLANELKRNTVDLADRASEELRRNSTATRSTIEEAFLAQQVDASAGLFQQMVIDRRRASELRDAVAVLGDLTRRAPTYGSNSFLWREIQTDIGRINRELGGTGGGTGAWDTPRVTGRVIWKGTVDGRVQLLIRGDTVEVRTLSGLDNGAGTYNFTSALPARNIRVEAERKKGRGSVKMVQQPSKSNAYTAIVEIYDSGGGARQYEVDVYWR